MRTVQRNIKLRQRLEKKIEAGDELFCSMHVFCLLSRIGNSGDEYFTTRAADLLKKKESVIGNTYKLIRVFYTILLKETVYDDEKMRPDICRAIRAWLSEGESPFYG